MRYLIGHWMADSRPGADESSEKWSRGREMKRSTQNDGDERQKGRKRAAEG